MSGFEGLDPGFADSLNKLFAAAPGHIGITSGFRTYSEQAKLYAQNPQIAAKPGSSWHEAGEAADLNWESQATLQWAHDHAAEFGLFFPMSWEPWHIQPLWTQGRKASASQTSASDSMTPNTQNVPGRSSTDAVAGTLGMFGALLTSPPNVNDQHPYDDGEGNPMSDQPNGTGPPGVDPNAAARQSQIAAGGSHPGGAGGSIGWEQAYDAILMAGGTEEEARNLAAIAGAESSYDTRAHADASNGMPTDDSYGLWQINMIGGNGPERRQALGLSSNDQLFDVMTNARAALYIHPQQGYGAWSTWSSGAYKDYMR